MKTLGLGLMFAALATFAHAGEVVVGKTCTYNPRPSTPDPGVAYGQYPCATSQYGEANTDWTMGGNTYHQAGSVVIRAKAPPPYIIPGCERGREFQVMINLPENGAQAWIFPRFLDCP